MNGDQAQGHSCPHISKNSAQRPGQVPDGSPSTGHEAVRRLWPEHSGEEKREVMDAPSSTA